MNLADSWYLPFSGFSWPFPAGECRVLGRPRHRHPPLSPTLRGERNGKANYGISPFKNSKPSEFAKGSDDTADRAPCCDASAAGAAAPAGSAAGSGRAEREERQDLGAPG